MFATFISQVYTLRQQYFYAAFEMSKYSFIIVPSVQEILHVHIKSSGYHLWSCLLDILLPQFMLAHY